MSIEYRPARADELPEFIYSGRLGFGRSTAEAEIEHELEDAMVQPDWTLCAFDSGVLAAKMATLPLNAYWNGYSIGCGGVTAVTTLPSHRRRGYLRELMGRSFRIMRDSGQPIAMLWATMAAIYQRFGYGMAFANCSYSFDPRRLGFVDELEPQGSVRLVKNSEALPLIESAYQRFAMMRTPMLRRDEPQWWRLTREFRRRGDPSLPPLLVAVYEEAGDVRGYVVYDVERAPGWRSGQEQRILVHEFVWLDPAAHRALVQFLAAYDLVGTIRFNLVPQDDPLFYCAQEPRTLGMALGEGTLLRIVDLRAALEGRGYDEDGRLDFELEDGLCPWNSGCWVLEVEAGQARLRPSAAEPPLRLTPRALAMLASGFQTATALARWGQIVCSNGRALRQADHLFQIACAPYCMDRF